MHTFKSFFLTMAIVGFAYAASAQTGSTVASKSDTGKAVVVAETKSSQKTLSKARQIPNSSQKTNWSKIKDLFM